MVLQKDIIGIYILIGSSILNFLLFSYQFIIQILCNLWIEHWSLDIIILYKVFPISQLYLKKNVKELSKHWEHIILI